MARTKRIGIVAAALALACLALAPGAAAQKGKKASKGGVPEHPSKLQYGALKFEVPQAEKHRHTLDNGVPVYVVEDHALPLVNISITVRAGSFLDPEAKPGLAEGAGDMMRRGGAGTLSAEDFDERADFLAANIDSFGGETGSGASLNCITDVLEEALDLFFQMLEAPRYQQDRMEVERENLLEEMKQRNDSPASISGREWGWLMYGRDHFSARQMTKKDLYALTREDLVAFHATYWRPDLMMIAVSGDVETKDVLARLNARFADWKVEGPAVAWPPPAPTHAPRPGVYYVDKDIPQGRVVLGHLGAQRQSWDDPEAFSLAVMNDILGGGGFTSRLVKRIRSDEGLAYSAGSSFGVGQYWPGVFQAFYQSKSETVAFAAKIALEEIERIRTTPVGADELTVAKNSFIDVFPRRFESAAQIAGTFVDDEYNGRPHAYWDTYRDKVRAVDAAAVQAAAAKYLHPDKLVLLIVGNRAAIEPGDADGRASMAAFYEGKATQLPLRDPLTLEPMN